MTQQCPKPFPIYLFHLNCDKTRELTICFNPQRPPFPRARINVVPIEFEQHAKILGLTFNSSLTWKDHIEELACYEIVSKTLFSCSACVGVRHTIESVMRIEGEDDRNQGKIMTHYFFSSK